MTESNIESKWKQVGDAALATWNLVLAEEAFKHAKDLGSLLLLYTSTGSRQGLELLSSLATEACQNNIAFTCQLTLGNVSKCVDILVSTGRYAEAILFSKTYKPSLTAGLVEQWKGELVKSGKEKIAKTIASPDGNLNLFPGWTEFLEMEHNSSNGSLVEGILPFSKEINFLVEEKIGGTSLNENSSNLGVNGTGKA
jgi:coatomer subunit beta'